MINNQAMSSNQLTNELLRILDRERPSKPTPQTIMQPPANTFSIIRQMYNSFKKNNQSRILQNKVYDLKIFQIDPSLTNSNKNTAIDNKNNQKRQQQKPQDPTPIQLPHLLNTNSKQHIPDLISNLLALKSYLPPDMQTQLIWLMAKQSTKIDDLPIVLKLFKKILKSKECIQNRKEIYDKIQGLLFSKILSFKRDFGTPDMVVICNLLYSLPFLGENVLQLIADLYQKVNDISDFEPLMPLYRNLQQKIKQTKKASQMTDKPTTHSDPHPTKNLLQSFLKITTPQHLNLIKSKTTAITGKLKSKTYIDSSDCSYLGCLYEQAIRKMERIGPKVGEQIGEPVIEELRARQRGNVDFLFVVLEVQAYIGTALVNKIQNSSIRNNNSVWINFIRWYQKCCKNLSWNYYTATKIAELSQKIFQNSQATINIIKILLAEQAIYFSESAGMVINLKQSISNFFIRHLVSGLSSFNKYLSSKHAKKIVAYGLMYDQLQIYEPIIINPSNLDYIDILLQVFNNKQPEQFFKKILSVQTRRANLQKYLSALIQQKPKKYKDFFVKIDSFKQGQIFQIQQHYLLRYFRSTATTQIIVAFFRDMASYLPSKWSLQIIKSFLQKFKQETEHKLVYSQALRTLNIILCTRNADQLSIQFKIHLEQIVMESKNIEGKELFKNVPEKMVIDLNAFYSSKKPK